MGRKFAGVLLAAAMLLAVGCGANPGGPAAAGGAKSVAQSDGAHTRSTAPTTAITPDSDIPTPVPGASIVVAPNKWSPVLTETFSTDVALGGWPGPYSDHWMSYSGFKDTAETGTYLPSKVLSVHGGALDIYLHDGLIAAPVPLVTGKWGGQLYGRFTVRFKADPGLDGFHAAWLLWPDSDDHADGEIDFPEADVNAGILGFNHCLGSDPSRNCLSVHSGVKFADGNWHTAVIEWRPASVSFILDGRVLGVSGISPVKPMHWILQTETTGPASASTPGHVYIDSVEVDKYVALPQLNEGPK